jgi:DNA-binding CsgD family transcriptional regulator/PAS domain-containing protein
MEVIVFSGREAEAEIVWHSSLKLPADSHRSPLADRRERLLCRTAVDFTGCGWSDCPYRPEGPDGAAARTMGDPTRVIEHLYSAAIDRSKWPVAVSALQSHFGASCAGIYSVALERRAAASIHLSNLAADAVRIYCDEYLLANPWEVRALQAPGKVRTDRSLDEHYNQPGYYRSTPYFNDFMKPLDYIHTLGLNLLDDRRTRIKLFLYRPGDAAAFSSEDVRDLECLTGHLSNTVRVARRIAEDQAQTAHVLEVFERLSYGVVLLDERMRVVEANSSAASMLRAGDGLKLDRNTLVASHRDDASSFATALRAALDLHAARSTIAPRTVRLRRASGKRALQVMFVPVPRLADDPFLMRRTAIALVISDPERAMEIPAVELAHRYGFTAAETSLAQSLARGMSLREAASLAGITYETSRTYLKRILQKTGTSRQAELISLLLSDRLLIGIR